MEREKGYVVGTIAVLTVLSSALWLVPVAAKFIERLNGHRGDLRFAHPSYWAHFEAGSREVVSALSRS